MAKKKAVTFEEAKAKYVHRFTMEHIPTWARTGHIPATNEHNTIRYYAPQFRTDREWYENSIFPPDNPFSKTDCHSSPTWPLGQFLHARFRG